MRMWLSVSICIRIKQLPRDFSICIFPISVDHSVTVSLRLGLLLLSLGCRQESRRKTLRCKCPTSPAAFDMTAQQQKQARNNKAEHFTTWRAAKNAAAARTLHNGGLSLTAIRAFFDSSAVLTRTTLVLARNTENERQQGSRGNTM